MSAVHSPHFLSSVLPELDQEPAVNVVKFLHASGADNGAHI